MTLKEGPTENCHVPSAVQGSVTLYTAVTESLGSYVLVVPVCRKEDGR